MHTPGLEDIDTVVKGINVRQRLQETGQNI
jgi:hypothetical protein